MSEAKRLRGLLADIAKNMEIYRLEGADWETEDEALYRGLRQILAGTGEKCPECGHIERLPNLAIHCSACNSTGQKPETGDDEAAMEDALISWAGNYVEDGNAIESVEEVEDAFYGGWEAALKHATLTQEKPDRCPDCGEQFRNRQDRYTDGELARSESYGCPNNCDQVEKRPIQKPEGEEDSNED